MAVRKYDTLYKADPSKVITLRLGDPFATLQEIANVSRITRERVRQILSGAGITTKAERIPRLCEICGNLVTHNNARHCSRACQHQASIAEAICSNCGEVFELPKSQLFARIKRSNSHNIFCSDYCKGQFAGNNYGFPVHPENIKTLKRSAS